MPLDSIIYSSKKDGSAFDIRTSERRNPWTKPLYISAEMLDGTNVCGTRASFIFLVKCKDGNERFMLIKERNDDPEKDAKKYKGYKTVGGRAKRHGVDISIEDAVFREAGKEGGFRMRNAMEQFIFEIDGASVVPIGVKFAENAGAVVFFLADLKHPIPDAGVFDDEFKEEEEKDYISEIRYFTVKEQFDHYTRLLEEMDDEFLQNASSKDIIMLNDRKFLRSETKDILLEYQRLQRPKKLHFTKEDITYMPKGRGAIRRVKELFQTGYRPRHVPFHGDLRIPDKLRSDILAKAGLEEKLHHNAMNTCKTFIAHDTGESLYESKLIVQTDLFFYELFINITYNDDQHPKREEMERKVEWCAKRYLLNNFRAVLYYNMLSSYMVKPSDKRDSLIDKITSERSRISEP